MQEMISNFELQNKKKMLEAVNFLNQSDYAACLHIVDKLKAEFIMFENVDLVRGLCFWGLNQNIAARQAILEELRLFPDNVEAQKILSQIKIESNLSKFNDIEFEQIYSEINDFTMVGIDRLYSLFTQAKSICQQNLPGNFVECGVAAGGTSALLAYVIKKYSKIPRLHYAFDSFEGMPEPTDKDVAFGVKANETSWGTGTCAAPIDSLLKICDQLGVADVVKPVKGYFCDTLPRYVNEIGQIAFLHMDGDWYESTMDILHNLYNNVVDNGFIQIDDYGFWEGCRKAVTEFELEHSLKFELNKIDSTGVWFYKPISPEKQAPVMLNLGCGNRWHEKWQNYDFVSHAPQVKTCNLNQGIPLESNSADVVYHSHLLEHFTKPAAVNFIKECHRVLKSGGIIRVAVPDLEKIAEEYLKNLRGAINGDSAAAEKYDWSMLEIYDQTVRNVSGGEMLKHWLKDPLPQKDYIIERMGSEVNNVLNDINKNRAVYLNKPVEDSLTDDQIGKFRRGGEVHQWMFDRFSLSRLLANAGFRNVRVCRAEESRIPGFNGYLLDIEADGGVRKPDSLFVEAEK